MTIVHNDHPEPSIIDETNPAPSRVVALQEHLQELAEDMQDMAGRVIANGGEPNYASEKLRRAVDDGVKALAAIDLLFIERFVPNSEPQVAAQFTSAVRARELAVEIVRIYVEEREWLS
jgi:hypothetical protein